MLLKQTKPILSWMHNSDYKLRVKLCKTHAKKFIGTGYNNETRENTKFKVFIPKLKPNHNLGLCEVLDCECNSEYIAYGLTYNINVELEE